jgi:hypothetical protein
MRYGRPARAFDHNPVGIACRQPKKYWGTELFTAARNGEPLAPGSFAHLLLTFSPFRSPYPVENMEPAKGIEPPTYGLRNRCSTD